MKSRAAASSAITVIDNAVQAVSGQRSSFVVLENRLGFDMNNLYTVSENLSAAQSRIIDADMAQEMTRFTKNNILTQAAMAMLTQANQAPQTVLKLLQ